MNNHHVVINLILYDGVCGLCNRLNRFIIRHDENYNFSFASIQSSVGQQKLIQFEIDPIQLNSLFVIINYNTDNEIILSKSEAILFIVGELRFPWAILTIFKIMPNFLLNAVYDLIAKNRYRIFCKYDSYLLPDSQDRDRFIDA